MAARLTREPTASPSHPSRSASAIRSSRSLRIFQTEPLSRVDAEKWAAGAADFVNYYKHERPHAALGGRPPISQTAASDFRLTFDNFV
ncbi:transposase [Streptomyces sp. L-9-10]|uniref:transposase n=1 Tax=Streptomyces sp. L-9-10 TaxID=1478131 RepID=UPI0013EDC080|nr:transposase [Streptomyces sp. L-9-10]